MSGDKASPPFSIPLSRISRALNFQSSHDKVKFVSKLGSRRWLAFYWRHAKFKRQRERERKRKKGVSKCVDSLHRQKLHKTEAARSLRNGSGIHQQSHLRSRFYDPLIEPFNRVDNSLFPAFRIQFFSKTTLILLFVGKKRKHSYINIKSDEDDDLS